MRILFKKSNKIKLLLDKARRAGVGIRRRICCFVITAYAVISRIITKRQSIACSADAYFIYITKLSIY